MTEEYKDITWYFDCRLPGQRMYVAPEGKIYFESVCTGTTPGGVAWENAHRGHRENSAPEMRLRAQRWLVGRGVDIGCGIEKILPDCVGVDAGDYQAGCAADVFRDVSNLSVFADGEFDWAYSSNVLEHMHDWGASLDEWVRVVRPGGVIFLCVPWPERCPVQAAGRVAVHTWNPSPFALREALEKRGVDVVQMDFDVDVWGCFCAVGRKREV